MSFSFQVKAKKTPFQRQKELEEQKKKRDDAEAAKVYEDFVKEFAGDDAGPAPGQQVQQRPPGPRPFIRGGTIRPGQLPSAPPGGASSANGDAASSGPPGRKPGGRYVPSFMPPGMAAALGKSGEQPEAAAAASPAPGPKAEQEPVFNLPGSSSKGKPRAIDALLANLKREQEEREARREAGLPPPGEEKPATGSFDSGDPHTTNLFIGNLAPDCDEQVLMREFGRFGPLGSVKVMWPRDEEQRRRGRNTGFVSFMKREDAERAMEALDGVELHDMPLMIGWGKSVPLPAVPCWPPPGGLSAAREGGAAVPPPVAGQRAPPCGRFGGGRTGARKEEVLGVGPDIDVAIPGDARQRFIIDAMAFYVMRDGCEFEQVIMEREGGNPEFNFLFDLTCPEHLYYRWRLFSLASGDTLRSWRVDLFQMVESSNRWIPPPMTVGVVAAHKQKRTAAQRGASHHADEPLSELQRDKFEHMLRTLSVERADICAAMAFALDNAECASEVVEILGDSLTLSETPIPLKIARLFLASDILHNTCSGVRNASRYRSRLEEVLPEVFESLQEAYRGAEGRMAQELLRRHVLKLLRIWRGWFIFSDDYLSGLQATFLRSGGGASAAVSAELEAELEALGDEELELRCRRSGVSRKGGRSAQISRLLALDAYLHADSRPAAPASDAPARVASNPTGAWGEVGADGGAQQQQQARSKWEVQDEAAAGREQAAAAAAAATPRSKWDQPADQQQQQQQQQQEPAAAVVGGGSQAQSSRWRSSSSGAGDAAAASSDSDDDLAATVAAAKRQAAAAAAATAAAAAPAQAQAGGLPAGGSDPALDDERRQRLRQVELVLVQLRERLEDKGLGREEVEARVAAQRAQLVADAEAALAGRAGAGGSGRASRGSEREAPPSLQRDKERDRERDKERRRSRSRERDRGGRERRRSRSRSRERRRSRSTSRERRRRSSRSRSRSRSPRRSRRSRSRSRDRRR